MLNDEQLNASPVRLGIRQRCPISVLFNRRLDIPASEIRKKREIKGVFIGKEEIKLSIFEQFDYVENSKNTKKLLELIGEVS